MKQPTNFEEAKKLIESCSLRDVAKIGPEVFEFFDKDGNPLICSFSCLSVINAWVNETGNSDLMDRLKMHRNNKGLNFYDKLLQDNPAIFLSEAAFVGLERSWLSACPNIVDKLAPVYRDLLKTRIHLIDSVHVALEIVPELLSCATETGETALGYALRMGDCWLLDYVLSRPKFVLDRHQVDHFAFLTNPYSDFKLGDFSNNPLILGKFICHPFMPLKALCVLIGYIPLEYRSQVLITASLIQGPPNPNEAPFITKAREWVKAPIGSLFDEEDIGLTLDVSKVQVEGNSV